ncbi:MAG: hypothetical protein EAZ55_06180 [Cytophagales bacterium]|nr:MAG: hypothetical protein EAZ55_06180 [Cytophagales bacterium]
MQVRLSYLWISLLLFSLKVQSSCAQKVIALTDQSRYYTLNEGFEVAIDNKNITHLSDIDKLVFTPCETDYLNFGFLKSPLWFRVTLSIPANSGAWIIETDNPYIDHIDCYYQWNGNWVKQTSGDGIPFSQRSVLHRKAIFEIPNFSEKTQIVVYIKYFTETSTPVSIWVWNEAHFYKYDNHEDFMFGGIFWGVLIMFAYHIVIYWIMRETVYLWYLSVLFSSLLTIMHIEGYVFYYLLGEYVWLNGISFAWAMNLSVICNTVFCYQFLNIKKYGNPFMNYAISILLLSSILAILLSFLLNYRPVATYSNANLALSSLLFAYIGWTAWRKGNEYAKYYFYAWLLPNIGIFLISGRNLGLVPNNPFTTHWIEIALVIEIILLGFALADKYNTIRKENENAQREANENLERNVAQRTQQLTEVNEALQKLFNTVNIQKEEIEIKGNLLTESITYAQRIQENILPTPNDISKHFTDSFVLYLPRDIVSGDFYWFEELPDRYLIVLGDCTGHGVPGAMMSFLGFSALDQIILHKKIIEPQQILEETQEFLNNTFRRQKEKEIRDGMDIGVCAIYKNEKKITYAGAHTPLIYITDGICQEIKPTKRSIGSTYLNEIKFEQTELYYEKNLMIFMLSDGYQDQFGGPDNKKFTFRRLRNLLTALSQHTAQEQREILRSTLYEWMENNPQTDDVSIIGFRLS